MYSNNNKTWDFINQLVLNNEADVENRFLIPLIKALGWKNNEIYSKVPVKFVKGRNENAGRWPEADLVIARKNQKSVQTAWIVIEAKSPSENINNVENQAFSYSYMLKSPFFIISNGISFEVWQTGFFDENKRIISAKIEDLHKLRGDIESIISKKAVFNYCKKHEIHPLNIADIDIREYLEHFRNIIFDSSLIRRTLKLSKSDEIIFSQNPQESISLSEKTNFFIQGWGGRGKSSIFALIIQNTLCRTDEKRIPISVSLRGLTDSLFSTISSEIGYYIPELSTVEALISWLKKINSIILLDDWDMLDDKLRPKVEIELQKIFEFNASIILTSRNTHSPPSSIKLKVVEVCGFNDTEIQQVVHKYFESKSGLSYPPYSFQWFLTDLPRNITTLLREPVILGKYLELLEFEPHGGIKKPQNLADLMDQLLEAIIQSRQTDTSRFLSEITSVCNKLADMKDSFSLKDISDTLKAIGIQKSPSEFAEELYSCRLWNHIHYDLYAFSHDIWKTYFKMNKLYSNFELEGIESLQRWINTEKIDVLRMALPFIIGRLNDPYKQDMVLNSILNRDVELYLLSLVWRGDCHYSIDHAEQIKYKLEQIYKGRFEFIEKYLPDIKPFLEPWIYESITESGTSKKPLIRGDFSDWDVRYYFGIGSEKVKTVDISQDGDLNEKLFSPEHGVTNHFLNLKLSDIRGDSGRLIAINELFRELFKLIEPDNLPPTGWIGREKLIKILHDFSFHLNLDKEWSEWSLTKVKDYLSKYSYIYVSEKELGLSESNNYVKLPRVIGNLPYKSYSILNILELVEILMVELGEQTTINDLGLPGPDLDPKKVAGSTISCLYSVDQKIKRVSRLFEAVISTYKDVCEEYFSRLYHRFFYSQCPCRAVVEINPMLNDFPDDGWLYWWEPCSDWSTHTKVINISKYPSHFQSSEELYNTFREKCQKFGRNYINFYLSNGVGHWHPREAIVTKIVSDLLKSDLERLSVLIKSGT